MPKLWSVPNVMDQKLTNTARKLTQPYINVTY